MSFSEPYIIFSGGTPADPHMSIVPSLTVMKGNNMTVLEMEHEVVDFVTLSSTPWNSGKYPILLLLLLLILLLLLLLLLFIRRQSLQCSWTSSLELSADRPRTAALVIQPFLTVAEDVFIWSVGLKRSVNPPLTAL